MKKNLASLIVAFLTVLTCTAQDGHNSLRDLDVTSSGTNAASQQASFFKETHFSVIDTIASRYWGTIVGGIFYSGPVNFTDFKISIDDKIGTTYGFVGMINPLDTIRYDYHGGTEYYSGVGKTIDLWNGGLDNSPLVRLNGMVMYDSVSHIDRLSDDLVQEYFRIELPRVPWVTPHAEYYHWKKVGKYSPPVGYFLRVGFSRPQPLGFQAFGQDIALDVDTSAGYSGPGLFGRTEGLAYGRMVVSSDIQVSKHFKLVPSICGQLSGGGQKAGQAFVDHSRLFYNLTLRWDF